MDFNAIKKIQAGNYNLGKISDSNNEIVWRKKYKYLKLGEITTSGAQHKWVLTKEFTFVPFECGGKQTDAFHYEDRVDIITTFDTTQNILLTHIVDEKATPEYWSSILQTLDFQSEGKNNVEEFVYQTYVPGVQYSAYLTGDQTLYNNYGGNADDDHFCISKTPNYSRIDNLMRREGAIQFNTNNSFIVFNPAHQTPPDVPSLIIHVNPEGSTGGTSNTIRIYNRGLAFGCYIKCNNKWSINYFKEGDSYTDFISNTSSDFIILNTASSYITTILGTEIYYGGAAEINNYTHEVFSIKKGTGVMQNTRFYATYKTVHPSARFIDDDNKKYETVQARQLSGTWFSVNIDGTIISGETVVKETIGGYSRYTLQSYSVKKTADSVVYFYPEWDAANRDVQIIVIKMKEDGSYELHTSNTLPYNGQKYNYINIHGKNYYKQTGDKPDWGGDPTADTYAKIKAAIKSNNAVELSDAGFENLPILFNYVQSGEINTHFGESTEPQVLYNSQYRLIHIDIPPMEKYRSLRLQYTWQISANNKEQFVEFSKLDMPLFPDSLKDQKITSVIDSPGGFGAGVVKKYVTPPDRPDISAGFAVSGEIEYTIPNDGKHHYINVKISNITETNDSSYKYAAYPFRITKMSLYYDFELVDLFYNAEEKRYYLSIRNNTGKDATFKIESLYYTDGKTYFISKDLTQKEYTLKKTAYNSIPISTAQSEKATGKIFILFTINGVLHALYR